MRKSAGLLQAPQAAIAEHAQRGPEVASSCYSTLLLACLQRGCESNQTKSFALSLKNLTNQLEKCLRFSEFLMCSLQSRQACNPKRHNVQCWLKSLGSHYFELI